eukprot:s348_g21.t1
MDFTEVSLCCFYPKPFGAHARCFSRCSYETTRKWATAFIPRVLHCLCPIPKCTVPGSKATINEHFVYKGSWIMAGWDADEIDQLPGFVTKDAAHGQIICQVSSFLCWML